MRTLSFLTMAMLCSSATAAPVPKELKNPERIVGMWKLESHTSGGTENADPWDTDWTIDENYILTRRSCSKKVLHIPNRLKVGAATGEIDWPTPVSTMYLGRYEVNGDQLTICLSMVGLPRPTGIQPNEKNIVWVLRRVEK